MIKKIEKIASTLTSYGIILSIATINKDLNIKKEIVYIVVSITLILAVMTLLLQFINKK